MLGALRSLPEIAANTAAMAEATRTLPEINERLGEVATGTSMLPDIQRRMEAIEADLHTIQAAMPTLVEVQQHLSRLPETMAELQAALVPLIEAADTLGRMARRFPGRRGAGGPPKATWPPKGPLSGADTAPEKSNHRSLLPIKAPPSRGGFAKPRSSDEGARRATEGELSG